MVVGGSFSRRTSGAHRTSACITPARTAEAGAPVMTMKNAAAGRPSAAARRWFPPQSSRIMPSKIETCMPDTATA